LTTREASRPRMHIGTVAHHLIEAMVHGWPDPTAEAISEATGDKITATEYLTGMVCRDRFRELWDADLCDRMQVIDTEFRMVAKWDGHPYGGTADAIVLLDGIPTILDYKTGSGVYAETAVQLEAYAHAWRHVGSNTNVDARGRALNPVEIGIYRKSGAIGQTAIVHCPPEIPATLHVIPPEAREAARKIWHGLIECERGRDEFMALDKALGKHNRAARAAVKALAEQAKQEARGGVPF